jgi:hypothetical protein
MPKPGKRQLSDKMQERNPLDMRQQIIPVDILITEAAQRIDTPKNESERLERTEDTSNKTEDTGR